MFPFQVLYRHQQWSLPFSGYILLFTLQQSEGREHDMTQGAGGKTKACVILKLINLIKFHFPHLDVSQIKIKGLG